MPAPSRPQKPIRARGTQRLNACHADKATASSAAALKSWTEALSDAWRSKPTAGSYGAAGGSASAVSSTTMWRYKATARFDKRLVVSPGEQTKFGSSLVIE